MHLTTPFQVTKRFAKWWLTPKPRVEYLLLCVTFRCNSRCQMCDLWKGVHPTYEMTSEEYERLAKDKALKHLHELDLTGGETFIREDLTEIIRVFVENHKITHLNMPTNGFLTDKILADLEEIRTFYDGVLRVGLSVDGYGDVHERIRRVPNAWDKAYKTWKELSRLMAKDSKFEASAYATIIGHENINEIPRLKRIFGDKFMFRLSCSNEYLHNNPEWRQHDPRVVNKWEKYAYEYCNSKASYYLIDRIAEYFRTEPYQFVKCRLAVDGHCFVWPTGDVYPCVESWSNLYLGNVREESLHTILTSDKAQEAKSFIRNGKCHCIADCMFLRNLKVDPGFHWWLVKQRWNGG